MVTWCDLPGKLARYVDIKLLQNLVNSDKYFAIGRTNCRRVFMVISMAVDLFGIPRKTGVAKDIKIAVV